MPGQEFEKQTEQINFSDQNEYDINFLLRQEKKINESIKNLADVEEKTKEINPEKITQSDIDKLIILNGVRRSINEELENIGKSLDIHCEKFFYYNQLEEEENKKKELRDKHKALHLESEGFQETIEATFNTLKQLLQSLKEEIRKLQNIEKQENSGIVKSVKSFFGAGNHSADNHQNLETVMGQIENHLGKEDISEFQEITDIQDSIESEVYPKLKKQAGNQQELSNIFIEIQEFRKTHLAIKERIERNLTKQSEIRNLLEEQSQVVQNEAVEYLKDLEIGKQKLKEESLLQNWLDKIETRKKVLEVFDDLGVDQESENSILKSLHAVDSTAVTLGRQRSFSNIRNSVMLFLEHKGQAEVSIETKALSLKKEIEFIKDDISISCNRRMPSAFSTLQSGNFMTIYDFDSESQRKKAKIPTNPSKYLNLRKEIEQELGWKQNEKIFSLAVDDSSDEIDHNGSAWQYGSIRFVFNKEAFRDNAIFTESDAINPGGLPRTLKHGQGGQNKIKSLSKRQIAFEHLPIAKAIFNLSRIQREFEEGNEDICYIEAQTNINPFTAIKEGLAKEIVLDLDMMKFERKESFSSWIAKKIRESKTKKEALNWEMLNMESEKEKEEAWETEVVKEIRQLCRRHNVAFRVLEKNNKLSKE